jgi:hypothetical protein
MFKIGKMQMERARKAAMKGTVEALQSSPGEYCKRGVIPQENVVLFQSPRGIQRNKVGIERSMSRRHDKNKNTVRP